MIFTLVQLFSFESENTKFRFRGFKSSFLDSEIFFSVCLNPNLTLIGVQSKSESTFSVDYSF